MATLIKARARPSADLDAGQQQPQRGVGWRQLGALAWIYFAYVCCYLNRKNFPLILPHLDQAGLLTTEQAGVVASVFETAVGIVKFFCGVFVDRHESPAWLLAQCLLVAGVACAAMQGVFTVLVGAEMALARLVLVSLLWSLNGAGQAVAWPALARVFMNWFPDAATRGFWYAVLATNQNVGGSLAPRVFPHLMGSFGWEAALIGPALFTLVYAVFMGASLSSGPEGPAAKTKQLQAEEGGKQDDSKAKAKAKADPPSFVETCKHLFSLPSFLCLAVAYIPVMMIRQGIANWTAVMFQTKNLDGFTAGSCLMWLEVGGFVGGLLGGWVTDKILHGRRGPAMCIFILLTSPLGLALSMVLSIESDLIPILGMELSKSAVLAFIYFAIGTFSFPPHSLIGLFSRELVPVNMRSTAGCLAKAIGQLGAACAGWPLQQLATAYGWTSIGYVNCVCGLLAALAFSPLWNVQVGNDAQKKQ